MNAQTASGDSLVISYLMLRRFIGILGIALPFVLALGGFIAGRAGLQDSISDYYHTHMRDVFVGIMCAIGVFLFSYNGYKGDRLPSIVAGVTAVGVALFPVAPGPSVNLPGVLHYLFAGLFFLTLAYFSLRQFTKTDPRIPPTPRKLQRNAVYRACGYVILLCLVLIVVVKMLPMPGGFPGPQSKAVFWLEAAAVVAFGFSWLVKGEALLKDQP